MKNEEGENKWAINEYENLMNEAITEYSTIGCSEDFLKDIDKILLSKIVADICRRNPDEEICTKVLKNFNENRQNVFDKFIIKNKLIVAKEAERIRHEKLLEQKEEKEIHENLEQPKPKPKIDKPTTVAEEKEYSVKDIIADVVTGIELAKGLYNILFPENDQHSNENEMKRFKKDVQIYIDQRFKGLNTDITFITTAHNYQCCIFYNQGITWTDVLLYYRKEGGDEIFRHKERYFYAFKAHRHEGILKEMLKHSRDIDSTWIQSVEDCK